MTIAQGQPCENPLASSASSRPDWCPSCRRAQGEIVTQTHRVIGFVCRECSYKWYAETGRVAGDILRGKGSALAPEPTLATRFPSRAFGSPLSF